jgi:ABC transporter substrate binding protein
MYEFSFLVRDGGLMSYGPDFDETFARVADLLDRIFKGAKPAELPFEQPTRFRFVVNLRTAKSIGLEVPAGLLRLVNAKVPVVLFDLTAKQGDPSGVAKRAIENFKKLSPPPAVVKDRLGYIEPASYDEHLTKLHGEGAAEKTCDFVSAACISSTRRAT